MPSSLGRMRLESPTVEGASEEEGLKTMTQVVSSDEPPPNTERARTATPTLTRNAPDARKREPAPQPPANAAARQRRGVEAVPDEQREGYQEACARVRDLVEVRALDCCVASLTIQAMHSGLVKIRNCPLPRTPRSKSSASSVPFVANTALFQRRTSFPRGL